MPVFPLLLITGVTDLAEPQMAMACPCDIVTFLMHVCVQAHHSSTALLSETLPWLAGLLLRCTEAAPFALASLDLGLHLMTWPSNSPCAAAVTPFRRPETLLASNTGPAGHRRWLPLLVDSVELRHGAMFSIARHRESHVRTFLSPTSEVFAVMCVSVP